MILVSTLYDEYIDRRKLSEPNRTSPAIVDCPLGISNFWNVIDIDFLLVKKSKLNAAFLIFNE